MTDLSSFLEHLLFWIPFRVHGNIQIPLPRLHFQLCIRQTPTLLPFALPTWLCQNRLVWQLSFLASGGSSEQREMLLGAVTPHGLRLCKAVSLYVRFSSLVAWSVRTREGTLALLHSTQVGHLRGSSVGQHAGGGWTCCSGCHWLVTAVVSFISALLKGTKIELKTCGTSLESLSSSPCWPPPVQLYPLSSTLDELFLQLKHFQELRARMKGILYM